MTKPTIPQGTRDFSGEVYTKRQFIFNTIRKVFELYGFQPLETPSMENIDTLLGKYGEEGDKLIFKILNNGLERSEKHESAKLDFEKLLAGKTTKGLTERALRYDLTIPFARYVAMNHAQLVFPYRRYQIQPVWRADKPQRGRYREFYQCDADVVGSRSLWNEVELAAIYHEVFCTLGLKNYKLHINSRKILAALAEYCDGTDKLTDITVAIDKLDKIGLEKVLEELHQRSLSTEQLGYITQYLSIEGTNKEKLLQLQNLLGHLELAKEGLKELSFILENANDPNTQGKLSEQRENLTIDFTLARGLNYYTGVIFEAKAPAEVKIGSIGGGGRYDDLTGLFGLPGIPGVGISFGVDRIYDVMEELNLFPASLTTGPRILFFNLGIEEAKASFHVMQGLRQRGISAEMYHEQSKFDKQFKFAERKNIPFAVIIGSKELENNSCVLKDLRTGKQETLPLENLQNLSFI